MNIFDLGIGFIIGVGMERAAKVSFVTQKAIKQFQANQRKKKEMLKQNAPKQE